MLEGMNVEKLIPDARERLAKRKKKKLPHAAQKRAASTSPRRGR
jgi:hypothetical protein